MANRKQSDAITIREIEYSIQMKDKDRGLHEMKDILRLELTRFEDTRRKTGNTDNPIRDFFKTNIDRSIVIRDSTRVYFLNYQEQGSLTIQFTLLVITRYINYGTTRQALDYLIKETIADYFEELLERHLPVSIAVHSTDTELYEIPGNPDAGTTRRRKQRDLLPVVLATLALLFTIALGIVWFVQQNPSTEVKKSAIDEFRDKYFELLIDKQVNDAFEKDKQKYLLYKNMVSASDSGQKINNQQKK
jgi:hypothetical protein